MFLVWVMRLLYAGCSLCENPPSKAKISNNFIKGITKKRDYQNFYIFAANLKQKHYV